MLLVRCHSGAIEKLWRSSCCKPLQAALVTTGLRARRASTPGTRPMSDWAHGAGDVVRSRLICEFQCARREPCGGNLAYAVAREHCATSLTRDGTVCSFGTVVEYRTGVPTCLIGRAENSSSRQKNIFCAASCSARRSGIAQLAVIRQRFGISRCFGLLQWFLAGDRLATKLAETETIALQSLKSRRIM